MRTPLCAATLWFLALAALPAKPYLTFSPEEQTRLQSGEVLVWEDKIGKKRFTSVATLLEHPVEQVWALIDDKEATPSYIANVRSARLITREENTCVIAQETEASGRTFNYVVEHKLTLPQRVDFRRMHGDFRHLEGYWSFEPVDESRKTLLVYSLHLDAGILVPQSFVISSQMKALPDIMTAIRTKLASQAWPPASPSGPAAVSQTPAPTPGSAPAALAGSPPANSQP